MEHQTLGRRFICPIVPATQREFILDWWIFIKQAPRSRHLGIRSTCLITLHQCIRTLNFVECGNQFMLIQHIFLFLYLFQFSTINHNNLFGNNSLWCRSKRFNFLYNIQTWNKKLASKSNEFHRNLKGTHKKSQRNLHF